MNFQAVKEANGQNVTMFGTFNEIGGVTLTQKNQKQVCKCQITDDNGEKHLIRIYNQNMPTTALLNMRQQFTLSSYQGQNQQGQPYTGFSGFWDDRAMVDQVVPPNAPQAPHTIPQTPPQQPNVPPQAPRQDMKTPDTYAYPVTPETARRMARTAFIAAMLQNKQTPLYSYVTELVEYSYTGIEPSKAPDLDPSIQNSPVKAQFCDGCKNLKEECTCGPPY